jgi:hypothetical protein
MKELGFKRCASDAGIYSEGQKGCNVCKSLKDAVIV